MFDILFRIIVIAAVTSASLPRSIPLYDGTMLPVVAYGTLGNTDLVDGLVKPAVIQAIESGYRHINTAAIYLNEEQVGDAIADVISRGIVTREELWITTKLDKRIGTREDVVPALQDSLKKLKLDYVDFYLIHSPENSYEIPDHDYVKVWKGMEDVRNMNLARYIGVSNFNSTHINKILTTSKTVPAANEIEVSPTFASLELVAYCQSLNITVLSYAPFGFMVPRPFALNAVNSTFEDPILVELARKYGKTPSQVVIRYLIDRGVVPIPKAASLKNIKSNIDVFDFELTPEEVYKVNELDTGVKVWYFEKEPTEAFTKYFKL